MTDSCSGWIPWLRNWPKSNGGVFLLVSRMVTPEDYNDDARPHVDLHTVHRGQVTFYDLPGRNARRYVTRATRRVPAVDRSIGSTFRPRALDSIHQWEVPQGHRSPPGRSGRRQPARFDFRSAFSGSSVRLPGLRRRCCRTARQSRSASAPAQCIPESEGRTRPRADRRRAPVSDSQARNRASFASNAGLPRDRRR